MSLIPEKYWNHLDKLKKCPRCSSTEFNIKTIIDVTTYFKDGKKVRVTKVDDGSNPQNFQCEECDLNMSEQGFEK